MIIWRFIGFIVLGLIIFLIFYYSGSNNAKTKTYADRLKEFFSFLDNKYESFVEKYFTREILSENKITIDKDIFFEELLIIIKPDLDSLVSLINSIKTNHLTIAYKSKNFSSLIFLTEELIKRKHQNPNKTLTTEDEGKIMRTFHNAVLADIKNREMKINMRSI